MKQALHIVLAYLLFVQVFSSLWTQVSFQVNQSYIVKTRCINRNNPKLKCNGTCYLRGMLQKNDPQNPEKQAFVPSEIVYLSVDEVSIVFRFEPNVQTETSCLPVQPLPLYDVATDIFHPPRA